MVLIIEVMWDSGYMGTLDFLYNFSVNLKMLQKWSLLENTYLVQWIHKHWMGENIHNAYAWQRSLSKLYNQFLHINIKGTNYTIKSAKELNRHFT